MRANGPVFFRKPLISFISPCWLNFYIWQPKRYIYVNKPWCFFLFFEIWCKPAILENTAFVCMAVRPVGNLMNCLFKAIMDRHTSLTALPTLLALTPIKSPTSLKKQPVAKYLRQVNACNIGVNAWFLLDLSREL